MVARSRAGDTALGGGHLGGPGLHDLRGSRTPAPAGVNRLCPAAWGRAGLLTEQRQEQPGRWSRAPPSHTGAAAGAAVHRAPRRRSAAGTSRDTGAPRPLRRGSGQARASRARRPPQPLPPAPASYSLAGGSAPPAHSPSGLQGNRGSSATPGGHQRNTQNRNWRGSAHLLWFPEPERT